MVQVTVEPLLIVSGVGLKAKSCILTETFSLVFTGGTLVGSDGAGSLVGAGTVGTLGSTGTGTVVFLFDENKLQPLRIKVKAKTAVILLIFFILF